MGPMNKLNFDAGDPHRGQNSNPFKYKTTRQTHVTLTTLIAI